MAHHAAAHFASRLRHLPLSLDGGSFVIFSPLDLLHKTVALALAFEASESLFDGLSFTNLDKNHWEKHPLPFKLKTPTSYFESGGPGASGMQLG